MFLYWPVVLIGLTILILFLPAPVLYHRSREWWAYSNVGDTGNLESFENLIHYIVQVTPCGLVSCRI